MATATAEPGSRLEAACAAPRSLSPSFLNSLHADAREVAAFAREAGPDAERMLRELPGLAEVLLGGRRGTEVQVSGPDVAASMLELVDRVGLERGRWLTPVRLSEDRFLVVDVDAVRAELEALTGSESLAHLPREVFSLAPLLAHAPPGPYRQALLGATMGAERLAHLHPAVRQAQDGVSPPPRETPERVQRIAVITHERPEELRRTLESYAENLQRYGHTGVELVVLDDSGTEAAARNAQTVRAVAAASGLEVTHIGPERKAALRGSLEQDLSRRLGVGPDALRRPLNHLFGRRRQDGSWAGSAAEQRHWGAVLFQEGRNLFVDDDTRPGLLDAASEARRAACAALVREPPVALARSEEVEALWASVSERVRASPSFAQGLTGTAGGTLPEEGSAPPVELLVKALATLVRERHLLPHAQTLWELLPAPTPSLVEALGERTAQAPLEFRHTDLIAAAERQADAYRAAAFTGHLDRGAWQLLDDFLDGHPEQGIAPAGEVLEGQLPVRGARWELRAGMRRGGQFSGSVFVEPATARGVPLAGWKGRNEDFLMAVSVGFTGDEQAGMGQGFFHVHERGRRWVSPGSAALEEIVGDQLKALVAGFYVEDSQRGLAGPAPKVAQSRDFERFARDALEQLRVRPDAHGSRASSEHTRRTLAWKRTKMAERHAKGDALRQELDAALETLRAATRRG